MAGVHAMPGPVVRGPAGCDVVFENDRPVVVSYAEAGAFVLHQEVLGAWRTCQYACVCVYPRLVMCWNGGN